MILSSLSRMTTPSTDFGYHRGLLNLVQEALFVRTLNGARVEYWNQGAARLYGWSAEEALGRISNELLQTRFPQPLSEIEALVLSTGSWEGPLVHTARDGSLRHVHSRWIRYEWEGHTRLFEINRDDSALSQRNTQIETLHKGRERFIATLSHEMRTPLNSILGFSDLLLDGGAVSADKRHRFLTHIQNGGQHLLGLINEMLDLARIDAGHLELHCQTVDVGAIEQSACDAFDPVAHAKEVKLALTLIPGLEIEADAGRLRQILNNLLSNAIKFTPAGGRVWMETRRQGKFVELVVGDTGIGIHPSEQSSAFEEFWRAQASGPQSGAGLGLAITRRLVEAHGGSIRLESEPGVGSRFFVRLPLVQAAPGEPGNIEAA